MGILNENDGLENLELGDSLVGKSSVGLLTKTIRALLATAVLGSVAAYGAITVKPELVEYLSFVPGMDAGSAQCSGGSCGSGGACGTANSGCPAASSCSTACGSESGSCSAEGTQCPALTGATAAEVSSEPDALELISSEE